MLKKTLELKKIKALEIKQEVNQKVTRSSYHGNSNLNANSTSLGDKLTREKQNIQYNKAIEAKITDFNERIKKSKEIKNIVKIAEGQKFSKVIGMGDSYITSHKTFIKALEHDCFYDIISKNDDGTLTIAFLPFSTSENKVLCGLQRFDKIYLLTNFNKQFYITRILFHKTMTKADFENGKAGSKFRFQDLKLRKIIFEEVQKDLDKNQYSILKDTDLVESNLDFFSKELPLVKFKFTDLEF